MSATEQSTLWTRWKAAVAYCPFCSGTGHPDADLGVTCAHCKGSGDLLGTLLDNAYRRGRDDALVKMREVYAVSLLAGKQVSESSVPPDLKRSMGL